MVDEDVDFNQEEWEVEVPVKTLVASAKAGAIAAMRCASAEMRNLEETRAAFATAKRGLLSRFFRWVNRTNETDLFWRQNAVNRANRQTDKWLQWHAFFCAHGQNGAKNVRLTMKQFAFFFPGDSFVTLDKSEKCVSWARRIREDL